jgi:hypothetical protein
MESDDRDVLTATAALAAALVLLALGAGCGAGGEHAAASTTKPPANTSLGALLVGRLYGDARTGCVWVGGKKDGAQIAWPSRYRVLTGPTRIETRGGRVLAREGDWLRIGGGFDPATKANPACPHAGEKGKWLPGKIEFLGRHRPPEVRTP